VDSADHGGHHGRRVRALIGGFVVSKVVVVAIALGTLVLGLVIGWFAGRAMLERQWSQPTTLLSPADEQRSAANDADPTPKSGTRVLRPMPLERTRLAMKDFAKDDLVVSRVAAVGNGEDGAELHVDLENHAKCTITSLEGVAYGFDAWGMPQKVNKGGEHYVAFREEKISFEPGKTHLVAQKLRYPDTASLAVAHVDRYTCADGTSWSRK
jgi:hypothetical protein